MRVKARAGVGLASLWEGGGLTDASADGKTEGEITLCLFRKLCVYGRKTLPQSNAPCGRVCQLCPFAVPDMRVGR